MASRRNVLLERFFNALISGDRNAARGIVDDVLEADTPAPEVLSNLFWPVLEHVQNLYRNDQLALMSYQYATRLLAQLIDQMQMRLERCESNGSKVLVVCGEEQSEELAGQMAADLLEAGGYEVYFAGGGVANDEIVEQLATLNADKLVIFGARPQTVPATRLLIDRLHDLGSCPSLQIIVGGGVFNRAEGLAEEIGADLWAHDPLDLLDTMIEEPERRMAEDQRTVGRRRRSGAQRQAA
ncbi:MAG: cobalamin B12-binding domain-containing protein [Phycisphaeraceae bacterium]